MMVNIELPPDMEARVRRLAGESGLTPSDYVRRLVEEAMLKERGTHGAALLAAWDEEDRTDDEAELKARSDQWEALKAAMNASHSSVPDVKIERTARIESPRLVHPAQAADFIMEISKVDGEV